MLTRPWLIAAIASALLLGEASAQGSWTTLKPIPQGVNEVIGAAVDGLLYVYGGERMQTQHVYGGVNLKSQPLRMFWSYDPKADTWTQLKSNPVPVHHGAAVGIGKKFYVLGGFRLPNTGMIGWYPENKAWAYDTETQSWSALPPMPTRRSPPPVAGEDGRAAQQEVPMKVLVLTLIMIAAGLMATSQITAAPVSGSVIGQAAAAVSPVTNVACAKRRVCGPRGCVSRLACR